MSVTGFYTEDEPFLADKNTCVKFMCFLIKLLLLLLLFVCGYGKFKTEGERNKQSIKLNHNMYMVT